MALETGSFIDDLVITNPLGVDAKKEGDDHLRLVKKAVKATFPGMAGAAWRVQGKAGAYTVIATDNMTALNCTTALTLTLTAAATLGNQHIFFVVANGGDVTVDPNGAETINGASTLTVSDGTTAIVFCNGTLFLAAVATAQSSVITTQGDIIRGSSSGAAERLAVGAADTFLGSDGTDPAYVAAATQAEQETGSATNKPVTSGRQHFHASAAKAWAEVGDVDTTPAIRRGYNMTSITNTATGRMTANWATNFSDADYAVTCIAGVDGITTAAIVAYEGNTKAAGTCEFQIRDSTNTPFDPNDFSISAFGDHA